MGKGLLATFIIGKEDVLKSVTWKRGMRALKYNGKLKQEREGRVGVGMGLGSGRGAMCKVAWN